MLKLEIPEELVQNIGVERHISIFRKELERSSFDKSVWALPQFGAKAVLLEFKGDPGFVIRRPDHLFKGNKSKVIETCQIAQGLFRELEQKYDIPVPVQFVVARNPQGEVSYYAITRKVNAVNVAELPRAESRSARLDLKKIFERLMTHFEEKERSGEYYLTEAMDDQYVFGTIEGQPQPRWYLVDTDPVFKKGRSYLKYMFEYVGDVMEPLETACHMKLPNLRDRILAFRSHLYKKRR